VGSTAAQTARAKAIAMTRTLTSYRFSSTSVLGSTRVRVQGRAVLPNRLSASFVSATRREQVVRVGATTYVRAGTGPWRRAVHAAVEPSPVAGLLTALADSSSLRLATPGRLTGQISERDAGQQRAPDGCVGDRPHHRHVHHGPAWLRHRLHRVGGRDRSREADDP
jgi:hypothetical protein